MGKNTINISVNIKSESQFAKEDATLNSESFPSSGFSSMVGSLGSSNAKKEAVIQKVELADDGITGWFVNRNPAKSGNAKTTNDNTKLDSSSLSNSINSISASKTFTQKTKLVENSITLDSNISGSKEMCNGTLTGIIHEGEANRSSCLNSTTQANFASINSANKDNLNLSSSKHSKISAQAHSYSDNDNLNKITSRIGIASSILLFITCICTFFAKVYVTRDLEYYDGPYTNAVDIQTLNIGFFIYAITLLILSIGFTFGNFLKLKFGSTSQYSITSF